MKTIVKSIKAFAKKVTGQDVTAKTVAGAIDGLTAAYSNDVLIKSSTPGSTKVFKLTVVDAGTITAVEQN